MTWFNSSPLALTPLSGAGRCPGRCRFAETFLSFWVAHTPKVRMPTADRRRPKPAIYRGLEVCEHYCLALPSGSSFGVRFGVRCISYSHVLYFARRYGGTMFFARADVGTFSQTVAERVAW